MEDKVKVMGEEPRSSFKQSTTPAKPPLSSACHAWMPSHWLSKPLNGYPCIVPLILLLMTTHPAEVVDACMATSSSSSTSVTTTAATTTTTLTPCPSPSNSASLIIDTDSVTQASLGTLNVQTSLGSCPCASSLNEAFYTSVANANIGDGTDQFAANVLCPTASDFCVCSVTGQCFTSIKDLSLSQIQFYSYCDTACYVYAVPVCSGDGGDPTDGLMSTSGTSTTFTCADVFNSATGVPNPVGSSSSYIKAFSVSCRGCSVISTATTSTCSAPFTANTG